MNPPDLAAEAKLSTPRRPHDPGRRFFLISAIVAPLLYLAHALWAWTDAWSPRHETAQYLKCVLTGPLYGMAVCWVITVPLSLVALSAHLLVKRRSHRRLAHTILLWVASAYGMLKTHLGVMLANDA